MVMAHLGGKLLVFQSTAPSLGIGKVKARDQLTLYNTEREASIRSPEDGFYKRCAGKGGRCARRMGQSAILSIIRSPFCHPLARPSIRTPRAIASPHIPAAGMRPSAAGSRSA